ncbi:hypothetical protein WH52_09705 [Tenacibaculum holothuriorum]|uniref:LysM domain-containing protein n=1 Tax=Tenacibaculum holothuriorum TaxID=1635173 RepID=A0A1Y2PB46_9FLAO|nr:hypothetical protein [Tenacibaculum holothuriorum]OSY87696.1 hypothetical protein WH52_09705 [Tenacibaculum holothuriorum]
MKNKIYKQFRILCVMTFFLISLSCSDSATDEADTGCSVFVWELSVNSPPGGVTTYFVKIGKDITSAVDTQVDEITYNYYDNKFVPGEKLCWEGSK